MNPAIVFALQFAWFSTVWAVVARLVVWPWSKQLTPRHQVALWIAPQMARVLGLGLLVPRLAPGMPSAFSVPTAIGDSLTAVLALSAFVTLQQERRMGFALAWACTLVGGADLAHAMVQAARMEVAQHLAAQWYVPALGVPLMVVCHLACFVALLRARSNKRAG